jgi:hypothetical protein
MRIHRGIRFRAGIAFRRQQQGQQRGQRQRNRQAVNPASLLYSVISTPTA